MLTFTRPDAAVALTGPDRTEPDTNGLLVGRLSAEGIDHPFDHPDDPTGSF
jgi:hypothetical protein